MQQFLKQLILFLLIFSTSVQAFEKEVDNIANMSAANLYNIDKSSLQKTIDMYVQNNPNLKALKIIENLSGEVYYQMYRDGDVLIMNKEFPKFIKESSVLTRQIMYNTEVVGEIYAYFKTNSKINLTKEEKNFLRQNSTINVVEFFNEPPFTINQGNEKLGYMYELFSEMAKISGFKLNYIKDFSSFSSMIESLKDGKVDVLPTFLTNFPLEKNSTIKKTKTILSTPFVIIGRTDSPKYKTLKDLKGKRVAVVKGYAQDKYLSNVEGVIKVHVKHNDEGFEALQNGKADFYINNNANSQYIILKSFSDNLQILDTLPFNIFPPLEFAIGLNGKKPELVSILNKALERISLKKLQQIRTRWIVQSESANENFKKIQLTQKEKAWLKAHPKIVFGADQNWQPYDFKDRFGKHAGFNADYLKNLCKILGIDIQVELGKWGELQDKVKEKKLAGLIGPSKTDERKKYMVFTKPYFSINEVVLVRKNASQINSIEQLSHKTLALKSGSSNIEYFLKKYPKIKQKIYNTHAEIIRAVSLGETDAAISPLGAASYEMEHNFISNIKIGFELNSNMSEMHFGIRKDWPELVSILQKGMDAITNEELNEILGKWLKLAVSQKKQTKILFNKKEQKYLATHPTIRLAYMSYWPTDDENNNIHTKYIELLSKYGNININLIKYDTWKEGFEAAKQGNSVHGIVNLSWSEEREKNSFYYTKPYFFTPSYLIVKRINNKIKSLEDLANKSVYLKKASITAQVVKELKLNIKPIILDSEEAMHSELSKNDSMTEALLTYNLSKNFIEKFDLKIAHKDYNRYGEVHIGISKNNPELHSIINKIYDAIPKSELSKIQNKTYKKTKKAKVYLTEKEKKWIQNNSVKVGIEQWEPMLFINDSTKLQGLSGDILNLAAQKTGLKMELVVDLWEPLLSDFKKKKIDLLPATFYTKERTAYGKYSKPYYKMLEYIYVKEENHSIKSFKDLFGKKLALPKEWGSIPRIRKKFPEIQIVETVDIYDSISRVLSGEVDALFNAQIVVEYKLQEALLSGLKSVPQNTFKAEPIYFYMNPDQKIMQSILQKGLNSITQEEMNTIKAKWISQSSSRLQVSSEQQKELKLYDFIPIKELLIGFLFFMLIFYFIWKYQIKTANKDFALKGTLFGIIALFLILAFAFTLLTLKNIEVAQKIEVKEALKTVLQGTSNTLKIWSEDKFRNMDILLKNKDFLNFTALKISNPQSKKFEKFISNSVTILEDSEYFLLSDKFSFLGTNIKNINKKIVSKKISEKVKSAPLKNQWIIPPYKKNGYTQSKILFIKPIKNRKKEVFAYLIMAINPQKELIKILQNGRIGTTGETYAFNDDLQLISNSRFDYQLKKQNILKSNENSFLNIDIKTLDGKPTFLAKQALQKTQGATTEAYLDYRGVEVYGAWIWNENLKVALAAEIDKSEAMGNFDNLRSAILIVVLSISLFSLFLTVIVAWISTNSKKSLQKANEELNHLLESFDKNVIASKTDVSGNITYASEAFCTISEYTQEELLGKTHRIVKHPEMPKELFVDLWKTISLGKKWQGEVKNKKKNGGFYWVDIIIEPEFDEAGKIQGYSAIRQDITAKKEVQELSENLEIKIQERTKEIDEQKQYIDTIMNSQSNIVISTDGKQIRSANKAFMNFYGINNLEEFLDQFGDCICYTFDTKEPTKYIQKMMGKEKWVEYVSARPNEMHKVKILKDNDEYIFTITAEQFEFNGEALEVAVFTNITELEAIRKNIETILSNIMLPVLITSKENRKILYANEYASKQYETSIDNLIGSSIDSIYTNLDQKNEILDVMGENGHVENLEERYKTWTGKEFIGLLSVKPITYNNEEAYIGMVVDITKQKEIEEEIRRIHKHTKDSIEYASLIQHALIPEQDTFTKYFEDYFSLWQPKDIVGGDIYLFEELRNDNECILFVIDCTGHGVPGAFVTMLVKAIERQITSNIVNSNEMVSPAKILSIFNRSMKHLLKQENEESVSNAGFDGGVLYYNKEQSIIKFAGAQTPLFYTDVDGKLQILKGSRHSIGYKKSDANYEFKEHTIPVQDGMKFYLTTDGFLDQNGGEKGFPFGKKRFKEFLEQTKDLPMQKQKEALLENLLSYQGKEERNDDIAIVGIKISKPNTLHVKSKNKES